MYCVISKKEKKIYFALESTPASHLFPIKASSKRLSMKKEVELGERVGRQREEREERPCVWMCVPVCARVCVFLCVFMCVFMFVCV